VVQALAVGQAAGLRAGYQTIEQLAEQLQVTRAELDHLRDRYRIALETLRRSEQVTAMYEQHCDHPTVH
jgi:hypothetical protein